MKRKSTVQEKQKTTGIRTNDIAVSLTNISKEYVIHHEKPTLVEKFVKTTRFQRDERYLTLDRINLTVKKGERVGIVGPNGSGKTTLLKIITGITTPTSGKVETYGKVVSLIDLSAGFHHDLTGIQNIYLNGMLLGMNKKTIEERMGDIIEFADIRQFIDAPLFTYSSGMCLRLGFAVAIHADPDIIVLDENLNVGDRNFQLKSMAAIQRLFKKNVSLLLVSHIPTLIDMYCERVVEINRGVIISDRKR